MSLGTQINAETAEAIVKDLVPGEAQSDEECEEILLPVLDMEPSE